MHWTAIDSRLLQTLSGTGVPDGVGMRVRSGCLDILALDMLSGVTSGARGSVRTVRSPKPCCSTAAEGVGRGNYISELQRRKSTGLEDAAADGRRADS